MQPKRKSYNYVTYFRFIFRTSNNTVYFKKWRSMKSTLPSEVYTSVSTKETPTKYRMFKQTFSCGLIQHEMLCNTRGKDLWYLKLMLSNSIWPLEGQSAGGLVSVSLGASGSRLQYSKMRSTDVIWQNKYEYAITTEQYKNASLRQRSSFNRRFWLTRKAWYPTLP